MKKLILAAMAMTLFLFSGCSWLDVATPWGDLNAKAGNEAKLYRHIERPDGSEEIAAAIIRVEEGEADKLKDITKEAVGIFGGE